MWLCHLINRFNRVIFLALKIVLIFVLKLPRCFGFAWSSFAAAVKVKVSVNFIEKTTWKLKFEAPYSHSSHSSNRALCGSALSHMVQANSCAQIVPQVYKYNKIFFWCRKNNNNKGPRRPTHPNPVSLIPLMTPPWENQHVIAWILTISGSAMI